MNGQMLSTPLDIIAECMSWVSDDKSTLKAFSLTSHDVRRLSYWYLFRRMHYVSGFERSHTLSDFLQSLETIPHLTAHVREFVVAPQRPHFWGLYSATKLTPCLLRNIIGHFPLLTSLILRSFTLHPCTHDGPCVPCPPMERCRNIQISRVLLGPLCHLDHITNCFHSTSSLSIRYIFPMVPFPTPPLLQLPQSLSKLDIHIPLDSGVRGPITIQPSRNDPGHSLWYDVWTPLQAILQSDDCAVEELSIAWTLSIVARTPGTRRDYTVDLSNCAHLHTVTLEAPLAAYGKFVALYVAGTLATLPRTVHTICLSFNPFRRSSQDPYANPNFGWTVVWHALANTVGVRTIRLRFADMDAVARLSYRDMPVVAEDVIAKFAQAALTELTRAGYVGTFAYTVEGSHL